ncbi:MAG: hydantoinase B/oxoprolinase family protein [Stappiaceae bacterium]
MRDPFTSSVIQAGLEAAAQEMFDVLRKTAMSPIIYEVLDVGTGVTDADGNLISSGAGIPSFVGVLDKSVQAIIARHGDTVAEGDVFITNDPNHGGVTHLNDVVLVEPVFHGASCVAWVASIAHWGDIGGKVPGSMAVDVTEIVAEGLRIPMVRLIARGRVNEAVIDIIRTNSRLPSFVTGDLWAQVSAGRRAAQLIRGLCERYGPPALFAAIEEAHEIGAARALAGLTELPPGIYEISEPQDDGAIWHASIEITANEFTVDLRDAAKQSTGPHNTSRDGAVIACQILFKALTDPERFANAGSFAPLRVLTRPGTIFDAGPTAPHGYYFETRIRLFDMLWHCLADAIPDLLPAGHFASIFGTVIAGDHPVTGRRYTMVEPQMGGWGATSERAGMSAMYSTSHGDTFNCPVEIAEARYGLEVLEKRLGEAPNSQAGQAGGQGLVTRYRMANTASLSVGYSHAVVPVWSLCGADSRGLNALHVLRVSGTQEHYQFVSGLSLDPGDQICISTASGGSYGRQSKRRITQNVEDMP